MYNLALVFMEYGVLKGYADVPVGYRIYNSVSVKKSLH